MSEGEVPKVKGVNTDWIVAWKSAVIMIDDELRFLSFGPMVQRVELKYGVNDIARCATYIYTHNAPEDECKCGFNAWHEKEVAYSYMCAFRTGRRGSLLRVGLSGQVVEGVLKATDDFTFWGYRASTQLVTDVFIEKRCHFCSAEANLVGTDDYSVEHGWVIKPVCTEHLGIVDRILHLSSLSLNNDVGVHWLNPSEYMQNIP